MDKKLEKGLIACSSPVFNCDDCPYYEDYVCHQQELADSALVTIRMYEGAGTYTGSFNQLTHALKFVRDFCKKQKDCRWCALKYTDSDGFTMCFCQSPILPRDWVFNES